MPNHVTNIVVLKGADDEIKRLRQEVMRQEYGLGSIDFEKIIPMPADIFRGNLGLKEREIYGHKNWYDWSIVHWNTKWNAYGTDEIQAYKDPDKLAFLTAWAAPHPILEKLSELYPNVEISHSWADEDIGSNCGRRIYINGCLTESYCPEYGRDSYEFAAEVLDLDLAEEGFVLSEDGSQYVYADDDEAMDMDYSM